MARLRRARKRAFTILEVITAIAILSVLAAIALPDVTAMFDQVTAEGDAILLEGSFVEARRIAALQEYHNTYPDSAELAGQMTGMDKAYTTATATSSEIVSVWTNGDDGDQLVLSTLTSEGSCIVLFDDMTSSTGTRWAQDPTPGASCNATAASALKDSINGTRTTPSTINL